MLKRGQSLIKKKALKTSIWDDRDGNATSSRNDDDLKLEELSNLCLMDNIDITKEKFCLIVANSIDDDEVNELECQITLMNYKCF
jgi:hypothetical protein